MSSHLCRFVFTCADGGHVEVDPEATVHIEKSAPVCSNFLLCPLALFLKKYVCQHVITPKKFPVTYNECFRETFMAM